MLSGTCPKCGSADLLLSQYPEGVFRTMARPMETAFGPDWRACLCRGCGYCEFYFLGEEAIGRVVDVYGEESFSNVVATGWYADPTGRHEKRRWSGLRWTGDVQDDGVESDDPEPV